LYTKRRDLTASENPDDDAFEVVVDELELDPEKRYTKKRKVEPEEIIGGEGAEIENLDDEMDEESMAREIELNTTRLNESETAEMEDFVGGEANEMNAITGMDANAAIPILDADEEVMKFIDRKEEIALKQANEKAKGDLDDLLSFADEITITIPSESRKSNSNNNGNVIKLGQNLLNPSNTSRISSNLISGKTNNKLEMKKGVGSGFTSSSLPPLTRSPSSNNNNNSNDDDNSHINIYKNNSNNNNSNSSNNSSTANSGPSLKRTSSYSSTTNTRPVQYQPVLEPNPKWTTLDEILKEIRSRPIPKREKVPQRIKKVTSFLDLFVCLCVCLLLFFRDCFLDVRILMKRKRFL
jgi:hypothetical protein